MPAPRCTEGLQAPKPLRGALPAGKPTLHCAAAEGGTGLGLGSRKCRLLWGLGPEDYECGWRPSSPRATVTPRVLQCEPSAAQVWCDHVCHRKCGLFPLNPRPGAWPHAWVRADLGWAEEEMVKVWVCITGPHPGGGGRALIPEAPLARFHLWAAPSSESCSSLASHGTQHNDRRISYRVQHRVILPSFFLLFF